ncbi:hypothetical protein [Fischerella thermalis]|uniref:hypothetical protein n=1 Tax=Fischerella thermalis TaxID=372787 RepID=UPI001A00E893|nr:hypothetical protein [Fischerella thermalis]MBF1991262.1 hypothetical protein [Fischerella thermalis M58_A2018_009]MBF2058750.1 hypothetical protein [Fischerella thermalis M66_A2018_004]
MDQNTQDLESDLEKVTRSEVGLRGIPVFRALEDAAAVLRTEIESVKEWTTPDGSVMVCAIELAQIVWTQLLHIRDELAPALRTELHTKYDQGLAEYTGRLDKFLQLQAWNLNAEDYELARNEMLSAYPSREEIDDYLQVTIARPEIVKPLATQLSEEQARILGEINRYIEQYDQNLERSLATAAISSGEKLAGELIEALAAWEPGKKLVRFRKFIEKQLKKARVLLLNADNSAVPSLTVLMNNIEQIVEDTKISSKEQVSRRSELENKIAEISASMLQEQQKLREIAIAETSLDDRSDWVVFAASED